MNFKFLLWVVKGNIERFEEGLPDVDILFVIFRKITLVSLNEEITNLVAIVRVSTLSEEVGVWNGIFDVVIELDLELQSIPWVI